MTPLHKHPQRRGMEMEPGPVDVFKGKRSGNLSQFLPNSSGHLLW